MHPRSLAAGALAASAVASLAGASMTGLCAIVNHVDGCTLVDLFATMGNSLDQIQSISLVGLSTDAAGGFVQGSTPGLKGWAPDQNFTSSMTSLDSFVTLGGSTYGNASGPYLANLSLLPAGWPSGMWNGTPFSAPANSIASPDVALGWSTVTTDVKSRAIALDGLGERIDFVGAAASSSYGAWFAHLVVAGDGAFAVTMQSWHAEWTYNRGGNPSPYGRVDSKFTTTFTVPAPGVAAALALAARPARRRRGIF